MKERQKRKQPQQKVERPRQTAPATSMSSKTIRKDGENVVRQYPAEVGYHGSGDETKLNPEE